MRQLTTLIFCLLFTACLSFIPFPQIVQPLGYPVETHTITCADGYILTYFRIQAKGQTSMQKGLPVIYLQHGVIDSSDTWVVNTEENALGLRLANEGYDVWLGNSRGNKYSMSHVSLNSSDPAFWQFSWQNMTEFDLPAAFEHIHKETNQSITYIGHSQGTTIMFGALSEQLPSVTKYLTKFIALSPITWVANIKSGPIHLAAHTDLIDVVEVLGMNDFMPASFWTSESAHLICDLADDICGDFLGYFFGADASHDDYARYDIFMEHVPSGCSLMGMVHWRQLVLSNRFCKYDYGSDINMAMYGQNIPPDYDLTNITQPVYLFLGTDDDIGDLKDQGTLLSHLSGANFQNTSYPADHMTWMWSKDISYYYPDLLNILAGDDKLITK